MSTTTFSGPVKAGNIFNTTGNTLSENVSNQGQATMVQVGRVKENAGDPSWTGIVIPANSQITRIAFLVWDPFDDSGSGLKGYVGKSNEDGEVDGWFVYRIALTAVGLAEVTTEIYGGYEAHWKDTGSKDIHLTFTEDHPAADKGNAVLIVEYIQNNNLVA